MKRETASRRNGGKPPRSTDGSVSRPFLVVFAAGVLAAVLLTVLSSLLVVYGTCRDVPLPCPPTPTVIDARTIAVNRQGLFGNLLSVLHPLRIPNRNEHLIECPAAPEPDPTACLCKLFWKTVDRIDIGLHPPSNDCESKTNFDKSDHARGVSITNDEKQALRTKYPTSFTTTSIQLEPEQKQLIDALNKLVRQTVPDLDERAAQVPWGGPGGPQWYDRAKSTRKQQGSTQTDLERLDGGSLYYSYLRIMKWPSNLRSNFPFKLCQQGCSAEVAVNHTLTFRETFKPWLFTKTVMQENRNGFVYHHGFSPAHSDNDNDKTSSERANRHKHPYYGSHSVVWVRAALRNKIDDLAHLRVYLNVLEQAVASSTEASDGRVGKFNVVLDGTGCSLQSVPPLKMIKTFVTMLQDHFPNRLGIILLMNLGRVGEFLIRMFLPLLTEEVRQKLIVLPQDPHERRAILETIIAPEFIPTWAGGVDTHEFKASEYYANKDFLVSDDVANAYIQAMPYHA